MSAPGYDLTARERQLMVYLSARETCPTYDEAAHATGIRGKGQIYRLVTQLEAKGYVRRRRYRQQSLEVLRPVEAPARADTPDGIPLLGPVPAPWSYPFAGHRTCAEWGRAEAA